jgi:hypothetical protein
LTLGCQHRTEPAAVISGLSGIDEFNAAVGSQGFREAASDLRWPFHPALYQVVRTG